VELNENLDLIASRLEGLNYTVFLQSYAVQQPASYSDVQVVRSVFPEIKLGKIVRIDSKTLLREVRRDVSYSGDYSHGPEKDVINSTQFIELLESCMIAIENLIANSLYCCEFGILDGHPAYPVFWDFSYLIRGDISSTILIGSSSD
jgi:hypothetical protein